MKKLYFSIITLCAIAGSSSPAFAQQLPNADFEGTWTTCKPWTNGLNTSTTVGSNPESWCISHVTGITTGMLKGSGKGELGFKADGYNNNGVKLKNTSVGAIGITRNVPAYMTLGTTWNTAQGTDATTHDGGVWGGYSFNRRPDALSVMYKRPDAGSRPYSFVAYMWCGSTAQASVPVSITSGGAIYTGDYCSSMSNRDRNILGMSTAKGGAVTKSSDFKLVAKIIHDETATRADWNNIVLPFEYIDGANPQMINVIFSANSYFTTDITKNDELWIDDVKLLYYSRLASLSVNGTSVSGFSSDKYTYAIDATMPTSADAIAYTVLGSSNSGRVNVALDAASNQVVLTVTNANAGGTDVDGQSQHQYTLQFNAPAATEPQPAGATKYYPGSLTITIGEATLDSRATVELTPMDDDTYRLVLPDFTIDLGDGPVGLGDIVVNGATLTDGEFAGRVRHMPLADGEILANVSLEGTLDANDMMHLQIHVNWVDEDDNVLAPIEVVFESDAVQEPEGDRYDGDLSIEIGEATIGQTASVYISYVSDTQAVFMLPDFAIDLGDGPVSLGDIVVEDVQVDSWGGMRIYSGTVHHMQLADGEILANVTLQAAETTDGELTAIISVDWVDENDNLLAPIKVTFNGYKDLSAAIGNIEGDNNDAPVMYYNLNGVAVAADNLTGGIYIMKQGNTVRKILRK